MATGGWRLDVDDQNDQHTVNICEEEVYSIHLLSENLENENDPGNHHTVNISEEEVCTTHLLSENLENENLEIENDPENHNIVISSLPQEVDQVCKIVSAASRLAHVTDKNESVGILFVGDGGAGKSALINGLLGRNIATEGAGANPVTGMSALENPYELVLPTEDSLVKFTVWDTPGIQDDHEDKKKIS